MTNISRAIQSKRDSLSHRKPGSIDKDPNIVWVKMINRHAIFNRVLKIGPKFNAVIDDLIKDRKGHYAIDVNYAMNEISYFTGNNQLTSQGMNTFWLEIDKFIKVLERCIADEEAEVLAERFHRNSPAQSSMTLDRGGYQHNTYQFHNHKPWNKGPACRRLSS